MLIDRESRFGLATEGSQAGCQHVRSLPLRLLQPQKVHHHELFGPVLSFCPAAHRRISATELPLPRQAAERHSGLTESYRRDSALAPASESACRFDHLVHRVIFQKRHESRRFGDRPLRDVQSLYNGGVTMRKPEELKVAV